MWIRSKNKEVLVNVSEFEVLPNIGEDTYTVYGYVDRSSTELGVYSSHKKALNVLDKIQNSLEHSNNSVFQMPQNEDVELTFEEFQVINNKYNYSMVFCNQFKCLSKDEYEKLVKSLIKEGFR